MIKNIKFVDTPKSKIEDEQNIDAKRATLKEQRQKRREAAEKILNKMEFRRR